MNNWKESKDTLVRAVWEVLSPGRRPQYHVKHSQHFWSVKLSFSQQLTGKQQNKVLLISTTPTTHLPSFPGLFRNKIVQTEIVCAGTQLAPLLALWDDPHDTNTMVSASLCSVLTTQGYHMPLFKLGLDLKSKLCMKTLFQS